MTSLPKTQATLNVKQYKPEGGCDEIGAVALLLGMLVVAAATGYVAHFISEFIYLIVMFPILIGLAVGAVGAVIAKKFKVRSPGLGGAAGLLCGVAAMLCMHYFDYYGLRSEMAALPAEAKAVFQLPDDQFEQVVAEAPAADRPNVRLAREALRVETFMGYMDLEAKRGVEIKKTGSGKGRGINLGYVGSYIYWVAEIGLVCMMSWGLVKGAASKPFCRRCQQWRKERILGFINFDLDPAVGHLKSGNLAALQPLVSKDKSSITTVKAYVCPKCEQQGEVDVKVERVVEVKKGKTEKKELAFVTYPSLSLPQLTAAFASASAEQSPAAQADAAVDALKSMGGQ
jgi:hypothetical protein